MKRWLSIFALLLCPLLRAQPGISNPAACTFSGDTCTFTASTGDDAVFFGYNFNLGGATATLDGSPVPIFLTSSTNWPVLWDSSTATSTVWVVYGLTSGSHTFTLTNTAGDHFNSAAGYVVTGAATVNGVEYVAGSVSGSGSACTGTATTTHTGDLLISTINASGSPSVSLGSSTQSMTLIGSGAGTPSSMYGVTGTAGAKTAAWNMGSSTSYVCDTVAFKPVPGSEPTVASVATAPSSPTILSNQTQQMTAVATYSDGGLQNISNLVSSWVSGTPSVAIISSSGLVNPVALSGTTSVTATFSSVTSPGNTVTITPYTPVNWYVRPNGGTRYSATGLTSGQCDGLADVDYPGTGINQHCAFNDPRFLYSDGVNTGLPVWVIQGSDIVTIRGSIADGVTYRIGYNGGINTPCGSGLCFGITGDVGDSGIPTPPHGSIGAHTIIQGGNAGSCHTLTARTQLHGGWGIGSVISLYGTQNITLSCFDITDFAQCGVEGAGATPPPPQCKSGGVPIADYAATGIHLHNTSTGITLEDINLHGLGASGLAGASGDGFVADNIEMIGNQTGGWEADDSDGTTGVGSALITNYVISWNGCIEEYPIVDASPFVYCYDQAFNVGADGFGTATVPSDPPGWQVHFDQGQVFYNTQDGLDALHISGTGSTMTVTRTLAYGNEGQQIKVGGATAHAANNIIFGNCNALSNLELIPTNGDTVSVTSNVATFTSTSVGNLTTYISPGDTVNFQNLVTAAALNNTAATVTAVTANTISVPWTHANMGATAEQGGITLPIPGRPTANFDAIGLTCRAGNTAVLITTTPGDITTFQDNTIYSNNAIAVEIEYALGMDDPANVAQYNNNIFMGFEGANGQNPAPLFSTLDLNMLTNPGASWTNNAYLNWKGSWTCPQTGESAALCTNPGLTNMTMPTLSTVNVKPASGASAVVGAGVTIAGIPLDYSGALRPNPPSIGALEFMGSTASPTTLHGVVMHGVIVH